jgi:hypothetical protein
MKNERDGMKNIGRRAKLWVMLRTPCDYFSNNMALCHQKLIAIICSKFAWCV